MEEEFLSNLERFMTTKSTVENQYSLWDYDIKRDLALLEIGESNLRKISRGVPVLEWGGADRGVRAEDRAGIQPRTGELQILLFPADHAGVRGKGAGAAVGGLAGEHHGGVLDGLVLGRARVLRRLARPSAHRLLPVPLALPALHPHVPRLLRRHHQLRLQPQDQAPIDDPLPGHQEQHRPQTRHQEDHQVEPKDILIYYNASIILFRKRLNKVLVLLPYVLKNILNLFNLLQHFFMLFFLREALLILFNLALLNYKNYLSSCKQWINSQKRMIWPERIIWPERKCILSLQEIIIKRVILKLHSLF